MHAEVVTTHLSPSLFPTFILITTRFLRELLQASGTICQQDESVMDTDTFPLT